MANAVVAPSAERFVETTLELIVEQGGSLDVNLRQISRRMGCAHTNVYNWYANFEALRWAAFRRALDHYAAALIEGLEDSNTPQAYVERVITNLATYPREHAGLYRFIGSDPIEIERVPADLLATVVHMKAWLSDVFLAACGRAVEPKEAKDAADIVLAYIDGETLNIMNGRIIPEERTEERIVDNAMRLFALLIPSAALDAAPVSSMPEPESIFERPHRNEA